MAELLPGESEIEALLRILNVELDNPERQASACATLGLIKWARATRDPTPTLRTRRDQTSPTSTHDAVCRCARISRVGSIVAELAADLNLHMSHTPANSMRIERTDVGDLVACLVNLGLARFPA